MSTPRQRRAVLILLVLALLGAGGALLLNAFRQNLVFFVSPTEVVQGQAGRSDSLRLGGLVQPGSIQRDPGSLQVRFVLTDHAHQVPVVFNGVLPDLFVAGKGAIAQGRLDASGTLVAHEVLAKHDENYLPPEVHQALKAGEAASAARQP